MRHELQALSEQHNFKAAWETLEALRILFNGSEMSADEHAIHEVKSKLYAIIERSALSMERLSYIQRLFRELFSLVSVSCDIRHHEKDVAIEIIRELRKKLALLKETRLL